MSIFKEKSWSVKLVEGYVLNNLVRSDHCKGCASNTNLVVNNTGTPDLLLYGCNGHKCKHILIRMKFPAVDQAVFTQTQKPLILKSPLMALQEIHSNS